MVTTISTQTRATADKELERLRKENEQLKKGFLEIRQGQMYPPKEGETNWKIKLLQVNPRTEFPIKSGETWKDVNGKEHPEYKVGKWFQVSDKELQEAGCGERKFVNIIYIRRN